MSVRQDEIVFMGGGVGLGNRSSTAGKRIKRILLSDIDFVRVVQSGTLYAIVSITSTVRYLPSLQAIYLAEAAQIVLNIPLKKTMIPLNVTHTAIVIRKWHSEILSPGSNVEDETRPLPPAKTPLRHTLSTLLSHFADAYKAVFGFVHGPPIHDALTMVYVAHPELFGCKRYHVDIELVGAQTVGETVVDLWDYQKAGDTWGRTGKNCIVAETLNVRCLALCPSRIEAQPFLGRWLLQALPREYCPL